ncbi:LCP family protein [Sanguibacter sp. HDW7]|uniref:LCP family protein n=1 Tax=Sanguibacter sp. HDW7 TaxID=2714931 RepID=UPI00140CF3E1|nr:LCP family protein [Sanguibacter sp. HDW7]QIK84137.1 LytR family transcriptional regulator [Sanguibacter sp. HDW7]
MTDRTGRPQGSPPPSFSPQGAGASRPASDDGAVPVGGANGPVAHVPARPTRRPTSGGTPRVARTGEGESRPASVQPRSTASSRPSSDGARPTGAAAAAPRRTVSSSTASGPRPGVRPGTPAPSGRPGSSGPGSARPTSVRPVALPVDASTAGDDDIVAGGPPSGGRLRLRPGRIAAVVAVLALVGLVAWPVGLGLWANGKITHVAALSGAAATDGTTYLLAGSDSREDGAIAADGTAGARTDTIMLLHVPDKGPNALVSLPRDTFVEIPGHGGRKLNASYAYGGPELLVSTVEGLTGLTVDHYVEIGLGGVKELVDAVGGVNLCLDYKVRDKRSGLNWNPGCHDVDGKKALAFVRMRYADPKGDLGRAERQRQLIGAVTKKAANFGTVVNPGKQVDLIDAGLGAIAADDGTSITDLGRLALAFRSATGEGGITGTPPVANVDYRPGGGAGSTVLLDPKGATEFWDAVRDGTLAPGRYDGDGLVTEKSAE